ncbi:MAG: aminopeptidase, partial [Methanobacteriota archaeon]
MSDPRWKALSEILVNHSTRIKPGENVLIEALDIPSGFINTLVETVANAGARPFVWVKQQSINRGLLIHGSDAQLKLIGKMELGWMKKMDVYMGVRGGLNVNELSDVPGEKMKLYQEYILKPVHLQERVNNTRWV